MIRSRKSPFLLTTNEKSYLDDRDDTEKSAGLPA